MKAFLPILILLSGCAGLSTQLPDISDANFAAEQAYQETQIFKQIAKHQDRLDRISSKVLIANHEICKKSGPSIGVMTHTLKSYSKNLRPAAAREIGATETPRVLFVRAGSPADKAGIKVGDYLQTPDGKALNAPGKALSAQLEKAGDLIRQNEDTQTEISVTPNLQCDYLVKLKMTPVINAYATGKNIIVTAGMMDFTASDDELAMIIGHELAHNEKSHIRKIITNYALSLGATRYARPFESEADYVGLYYAARAGFDIEHVEDIWRRLAKTSARPIARAKTHPTYPDRYVRLAAARDEINAKIKAGNPLIPNQRAE